MKKFLKPWGSTLAGRVLRVDGVLRGYTFGFGRLPSVFCVLVEIADRNLPGGAQVLFREICREAESRGYEFLNTMDAGGLPGLAESKAAYHPIAMVPNYIATES